MNEVKIYYTNDTTINIFIYITKQIQETQQTSKQQKKDFKKQNQYLIQKQ